MLQVTTFIYISFKNDFLKWYYKFTQNVSNITKNIQMIRYIRMLLNIELSLYDTETFGRKFFPKY